MRENRIESEYFEWIVGQASSLLCHYGNYQLLSGYLYNRDFYSDQGNDEDRAEDGLELRTQFAEAKGYSTRMVANALQFPCTVLEMMLALAIRCEEHIMGDGDGETDSGRWLYSMIENLHLDGMTDAYFNEDICAARVNIFLEHRYARNGDGGLFSIHKSRKDMRHADIWYQMCWYLAEIMEP